MDAGGVTIACAIVYGWTGAKKGNDFAARTDDILAIVDVQFEAMGPGPKLIMGTSMGHSIPFPRPWPSSQTKGGQTSEMMKPSAMANLELPPAKLTRTQVKAGLTIFSPMIG